MMRRFIKLQLIIILAIGAIVVMVWATGKVLNIINPILSMKLISPAFEHQQSIPPKYTCDGSDTNPPLAWSDVPANTKSIALIVDDPDAPMGTWVHWTMWNIDPKTTQIVENNVPVGAIQGLTSSNTTAYGGPCPPNGTHRYFFKLYALDTVLDLPASSDKAALEAAFRGHVLASVELMGMYQRKK